jgi:hypothetical protein
LAWLADVQQSGLEGGTAQAARAIARQCRDIDLCNCIRTTFYRSHAACAWLNRWDCAAHRSNAGCDYWRARHKSLLFPKASATLFVPNGTFASQLHRIGPARRRYFNAATLAPPVVTPAPPSRE